jgi:high-affinity Fe2+/Pb2+ permease
MDDQNARIYAGVMLALGLLAAVVSVITIAIASVAHQRALVVTGATILIVALGLAVSGFLLLSRHKPTNRG